MIFDCTGARYERQCTHKVRSSFPGYSESTEGPDFPAHCSRNGREMNELKNGRQDNGRVGRVAAVAGRGLWYPHIVSRQCRQLRSPPHVYCFSCQQRSPPQDWVLYSPHTAMERFKRKVEVWRYRLKCTWCVEKPKNIFHHRCQSPSSLILQTIWYDETKVTRSVYYVGGWCRTKK